MVAQCSPERLPATEALEAWMRQERKALWSKSPMAKAMDYSLKSWPAFTRVFDDGRTCLSNNAAERAKHGVAVARRNRTCCGSDAGGRRAAAL